MQQTYELGVLPTLAVFIAIPLVILMLPPFFLVLGPVLVGVVVLAFRLKYSPLAPLAALLALIALLIVPVADAIASLLGGVRVWDVLRLAVFGAVFGGLLGLFLHYYFPAWLIGTQKPRETARVLNVLQRLMPRHRHVLALAMQEQLAVADYAGALASIDRAIALHPKNLDLLRARMQLHGDLTHYEAALADAQRIENMQSAPLPQDDVDRAFVLLHLKRYDEAQTLLDRASRSLAQQNTSNPHVTISIHLVRASLLGDLGEWSQAEAQLAAIEALEMTDEQRQEWLLDIRVTMTRGSLALQRGDCARAVQQRDSQDVAPGVWPALAVAVYLQGQHDEARQHWRTAIRKEPRYADATWAVKTFRAEGAQAEAIRALVADAARSTPGANPRSSDLLSDAQP